MGLDVHPESVLQQQARFDVLLEQDNRERPHQALAMKVPAELYTPSPRPYRGLQDVDHPLHDRTGTVARLRSDLLESPEESHRRPCSRREVTSFNAATGPALIRPVRSLASPTSVGPGGCGVSGVPRAPSVPLRRDPP